MLNKRLLEYITYFERLATQPPNRWEGFTTQEATGLPATLRMQLAYSCYALAALCRHPEVGDLDRHRCRAAMGALIERMLQRRIWASWVTVAEQRGLPPDPIADGNGAYVAALAAMIGAFEVAGGDRRYDEEFALFWTSDYRFSYTHTALVELLWRCMRARPAGAPATSPGRVEAPTALLALLATTLHDLAHGGDYAAANTIFLRFLPKQMALRGPRLPGRGALSVAYLLSGKVALPYSSNLNDAAALALLVTFAPDMARQLVGRLWPHLRQEVEGQAALLCGRDGAETAQATGFAFLLATELDDKPLAASFQSYAEAQFQPIVQDDARWFRGGQPEPLVTALFALGEAGGLRRIIQPQEQPIASTEPAHDGEEPADE